MRNPRLWAYVAVLLALVGLALLAPHVWATTGLQGGTVPTPTRPGQPRATSIVPTPRPEPSQPPAGSGGQSGGQAGGQAGGQVPGGATVLPIGTAVAPTPERPAVAPLQLAVIADPPMAWPGATIHLTATLRNAGAVPIQQIVMTNTLSSDLRPGPLPAGSLGSWSGQQLRVPVPALAPGESLAVPFSAIVERDVRPGTVLQTVAVATAGTGQTAFLQTLLPMPPPELPPTGGRLRFR